MNIVYIAVSLLPGTLMHREIQGKKLRKEPLNCGNLMQWPPDRYTIPHSLVYYKIVIHSILQDHNMYYVSILSPPMYI